MKHQVEKTYIHYNPHRQLNISETLNINHSEQYKTVTIKIDKTTRVKYKMSIIRHSTIIKSETTLGPKTLNT
jgi:hypothetical protein